jgi:hypothetical protein
MPQCPTCNAAIWIGQRYCSTCDGYLPNPEEEDRFCPNCHIRVAPQQEICHKCNASLMEMAGTISTAPARVRKLSPWVLCIFIGTSLVIVVLLLVFLSNIGSGPPLPIAPPPSPPASGQTPATSPPKVETAPSAPQAPVAQEPAVPSLPATPAPPEETTPAPSLPRYSVKVRSLALRDAPTRSASRLATLNFQDEVELIETDGAWGRVRDVRGNIVGWSYMRYLVPVKADRP